MKVWELCNQLKGTNATRETIKNWAYSNKVCPITFDEGLELDEPCPTELKRAMEAACGNHCDMACLESFLDMEVAANEH